MEDTTDRYSDSSAEERRSHWRKNLAGIGSMALSPGKICLGINVTGNHMKAVLEGDTVTAYGRCIHKGRTLHLWHIELKKQRRRNSSRRLR